MVGTVADPAISGWSELFVGRASVPAGGWNSLKFDSWLE